MEDLEFATTQHAGHKVSGVRRLVGISQKDLADRLGVTKQAVSKLEQSEKINDERLDQIAGALGVTTEGLKKFNNESVIYYTNNFYENCGVSATNGGVMATGKIENNNHFSIEQAEKLFEMLLKMDKEKFEEAKRK
ncbi:helix-turn-helix domain-containing protein [Rhizosphaericola mali]|uniref:Helix-turn-helix transcriptional regulator n=1 Tax=Rhizosphaericola mali TaxID=2545455 RepID=A0A5P2G320_9BACT|nr:helix-turn-helix transcriptional regulator [Rhizosphaericola mali]QES88519.1 helix-turn-helix transcriptional regulator [Rhizosphaericola mali]